MRDDRAIRRLRGQLDGLERLGQGSDLVELDQNGVGDAQVDATAEELGVGDEHVVADQLDAIPELGGQVCPTIPVLFRHAVLDGDDRVPIAQLHPVVGELGRAQGAPFALEDVLTVLPEL